MGGAQEIKDVTIPLQELVIRAHVGNAPRENALNLFRPALFKLRKEYKSKSGAPDYSERHARGAYELSYYPNHVMAYANMFARAGPDNLGIDGGTVRLVVLGVGPGSEVLGLLHAANCMGWGPFNLEMTLVDKEIGWKNSHQHTLVKACSEVLGRDIEAKNFEVINFNNPDGLSGLRRVISEATLVLVPMLLSETEDRGKSGQITDAIFSSLRDGSRLVISDLSWIGLTDEALQELQKLRADCRLIWSEDTEFVVRDTHPDLEEFLFVQYGASDSDGLIARKRLKIKSSIFAIDSRHSKIDLVIGIWKAAGGGRPSSDRFLTHPFFLELLGCNSSELELTAILPSSRNWETWYANIVERRASL